MERLDWYLDMLDRAHEMHVPPAELRDAMNHNIHEQEREDIRLYAKALKEMALEVEQIAEQQYATVDRVEGWMNNITACVDDIYDVLDKVKWGDG